MSLSINIRLKILINVFYDLIRITILLRTNYIIKNNYITYQEMPTFLLFKAEQCFKFRNYFKFFFDSNFHTETRCKNVVCTVF